MKEKTKTIIYTAPKSGDKIQLEVGDKGTVKYNGKVLKQHVLSGGYMYCYSPAEFRGMLPVHRLVAIAWVKGRTTKKNYVDHINSNRKDNSASNLRWLTKKANNKTEHARKAKSTNASHQSHYNECIRAEKDGEVKYFINGHLAAKELGCTHPLIYNVLNKNHWAKTAKGWTLQWVTIDSINK